MKQDDILREKFGRENHFRVPEGYFDDFADRMMEMIPEAAEAPAALRPAFKAMIGFFLVVREASARKRSGSAIDSI